METDVAIIGAGGAGLAAAIEVARQGARVAVIDASDEAGGTARTAGGGTCIAGSPLQRELSVADSPEVALEDWLAWGGPDVDEEWARRYLEASVPELYEGLGRLGVEWIGLRPNEGNRVPRWHEPKGGGRAVTLALEEQARRLASITWHLRTRALELTRAAGRVTGVVVDGQHGLQEIAASSVLVATGGFTNNLTMVRENATAARQAERVLLGGGRGAIGGGHALLAAIGARFVNLDAVWMYPYGTPDPHDTGGERGLVVRGVDGDVWVNADGVRFHDESRRGGATGTVALLAQPEASCWSIIDARIAANVVIADPRYRHGGTPIRDRVQELLDTSPFIARADRPEELARHAGIDPKGLKGVLDGFNGRIRAGEATEPEHGRSLEGLRELTEPPFYAIRFFPLARKNLGGARTDLACRVLDHAAHPIPGLFAAGEVAGMAGGRINGRAALEGTMFGPSCFSGMVAGRNMVA